MKEILLVEDTDADAELLQRTLRLVGVVNPVRRMVNGIEALSYLADLEKTAAIGPPLPSILLLDLKMPGITGFEVLERLRARPAFAKMLKVVLSQLDDTKSIQRAYNLGADSFLIKPITEAELRGLIQGFPGHWTFAPKAPPSGKLPFRLGDTPG